MKKVVVFFIVAMVVFGACSAQRADAQSANNAQRIIGTWVQNGSTWTWVFNANGTLTRTDSSDGEVRNYKFGVTDTMVSFHSSNGGDASVYSISISPDGKTLILNNSGGGGFWLTKK